jgi:hypothetical protein
MAIELKQGSKEPTASAAFDDDKSGSSVLHMAANAKIKTSLIGIITQTSPGVIVGLGGDTALSIPGGATPIGLRYFGAIPASTGASITIGIDTTSNYFLNGQSVATLALSGQQLPQLALNLGVPLALLPSGQAHPLTGYFSQTATSPGGGPWFVEIDYFR